MPNIKLIQSLFVLVSLTFAGTANAQTKPDDQINEEASRAESNQPQPDDGPEMSEAEIAKLPRDERRTKYLEGFTCERMYKGQPAYLRYFKGGRGAFGIHEGETTFGWKIQDDQICIVNELNKKNCGNLPKRDLSGGRSEFLSKFRRNCL